jgi:crotonobetainyl-CoA:carnitine CoA-transferase CaiB-like acyl-CoA transferase
MITFDPAAKGPLHGIRVLDISRVVVGNMLSLQLGDFGADVIKVEPPEGDPLRHWRENGKSLFWKAYGRNKRSIVLNLRDDGDKAILEKLADCADVFIENFRPGVLEAMGFEPRRLLERNPQLIVVRVSGFGQTGPYAERAGFGTMIEAMSGFADRTGFPDREPVLPPLALADMISGITGAMATLAALRARDTGQAQGQVIDLSLLEPMISTLGPEAAIYHETKTVKERAGSGSHTSAPRNVYRCRDGKYVALSASTQAMAFRVFDLIGRPDMKTDPRFSINAERVKNRPLVDEIVGAWFGAKTQPEALALTEAAGLTVAPVYNIEDQLADPHFAERQIYVDVEDKELGAVAVHNIAPRLSATPGVFRIPAPELGEHTEAILAEIGYDAAAIEKRRAKEKA